MPSKSNVTKDHDEIRRWAEERGGKPSHVKSTESGDDIGILRLDFPGYSGADSLEEITWDQFFEKFDERDLALLYQKETAGGQRSNFNKIVGAETAEQAESGGRGGRSGAGTRSRGGSKTSNSGSKTASKKSGAGAAKKSAASKKTAKRSVAGRSAATASKKSNSASKRAAAKKSGSKTSSKKTSSKKPAKKSSATKRR